MKVIASQGQSRYLIVQDEDAGRENAATRAQVLDIAQGTLLAPFRFWSLLARGPWEPCEVSSDQLARWLAQVFIPRQENGGTT